MKKLSIISLAFILIVSTFAINSSAYNIIETKTPSSVWMYNETKVIIELKDPTNGTPLVGLENNITIYIQDGNGSYIINGVNPTEITDGIYSRKVTITNQMGIYIVWATLNYNDKNYTSSNVFEIRWDIYNNMTALAYRMHDVVSLLHWESQNSTYEIISHLTDTKKITQESSLKTEELGLFSKVQDTALSSFFSIVFMALLTLGAFLIATWLYGRKKGYELASKVANIPKTMAGWVVGRELKE